MKNGNGIGNRKQNRKQNGKQNGIGKEGRARSWSHSPIVSGSDVWDVRKEELPE